MWREISTYASAAGATTSSVCAPCPAGSYLKIAAGMYHRESMPDQTDKFSASVKGFLRRHS
jgi:hypothetical protein